MTLKLKSLLIHTAQAMVGIGALAVSSRLADPVSLKIPLMLLGILGLLPLIYRRLRAGTHLLPGLLLFSYLYVRLAPSPGQHAAALALLACAAAFLLGISRAPLAGVKILVPLLLLCVGRGVMDLVTLQHLGGEAPAGHSITSFFLDKHIAGGVLVLGAFLHFHMMEKGEPHKPVQVFLYTSSLIVMLAIVLSDSRIVQGAFVACFLPMLFLSIRLDGKEPAMERLAWIAGITLCIGLAWINLPELQLRHVAEAFSPTEPGLVRFAWSTALETVDSAPLLGSGVGAFRYASVEAMGGWLEPGRAGILPVLTHAHNHYLQVMAEAGALAFALELFLVFIALLGTAIMYFREWKLQAKYAFFSLAALSLMGLFTPVLDTAPLNVAYWALVGYGWSFAIQAAPRWLMPHRDKVASPRRRDRVVGALTAAALVLLSGWHLYHRARELQSMRLFLEAQDMAQSNPKKSTDRLAMALAWDPRNEEANYSYARVLAFFRREQDAVKRVGYVQGFAPDWRRESEVLAEIYQTLGHNAEAAAQAGRLLETYPDYLSALELKAELLRLGGRCADLDTFRMAASRLAAVYRMPESRAYTIQSLDSLFHANREINFLQRWFAGPALRRSFVDRQMLAYNRSFQYYSRARFLREARCPTPEEMHHEQDRGGEPFWQAPAGITPGNEPEPTAWPKPAPKVKKKLKRKKWKHRNLAGGVPGAGRPGSDEAVVTVGFLSGALEHCGECPATRHGPFGGGALDYVPPAMG